MTWQSFGIFGRGSEEIPKSKATQLFYFSVFELTNKHEVYMQIS